MKLLWCETCCDLILLTDELRSCACGQVSGYYEEDGLNAVYSGDRAIPVGFANNSFLEALQNQPESGMGKRFTAFVIPKECPTMKKICH